MPMKTPVTAAVVRSVAPINASTMAGAAGINKTAGPIPKLPLD